MNIPLLIIGSVIGGVLGAVSYDLVRKYIFKDKKYYTSRTMSKEESDKISEGFEKISKHMDDIGKEMDNMFKGVFK